MEKKKNQIEKLWSTIKDEVAISVKTNESSAKFLEKSIIKFNSFSEALAARIATKVSNSEVTKGEIEEISKRQFSEFPEISDSAS